MTDTPAADATTPARPLGEIIADIEQQRTALNGSFESLRGSLDEALDAGQQRVRAVGKKAAVIGPIAAGVTAAVAAAAILVRRRSTKS
jgi:hypothetical protein